MENRPGTSSQAYRAPSTGSMSDEQLEDSFHRLVIVERRVLHLVLDHIREIDRRRLYLARGFESSIAYLIKKFGYSRSAAENRLYAARLIQAVPDVGERVRDGKLKLSQLGQLSSAIKQKERESKQEIGSEEKSRLLRLIEGKTCWETQKELSAELDLPYREADKQIVQKNESVFLSLTLRKDQHELLMKCRDYAFHLMQKNFDHSVAGLIEVLCLRYLQDMGGTVRDPESVSTVSRKYSKAPLSSMTPKLRKLILSRDKHCQFVDSKTGVACKSTVGLQIDHIIPKWAGGYNSPENLQVLCGQHNRYRYDEQAGIKIR